MLAFQGASAKDLPSVWKLVSLLHIPSMVQDESSWAVAEWTISSTLVDSKFTFVWQMSGAAFRGGSSGGGGSSARESKPKDLKSRKSVMMV